MGADAVCRPLTQVEKVSVWTGGEKDKVRFEDKGVDPTTADKKTKEEGPLQGHVDTDDGLTLVHIYQNGTDGDGNPAYCADETGTTVKQFVSTTQHDQFAVLLGGSSSKQKAETVWDAAKAAGITRTTPKADTELMKAYTEDGRKTVDAFRSKDPASRKHVSDIEDVIKAAVIRVAGKEALVECRFSYDNKKKLRVEVTGTGGGIANGTNEQKTVLMNKLQTAIKSGIEARGITIDPSLRGKQLPFLGGK